MDRQAQPADSLARRLLWFAALWAAGVLAVGGIAWLIRLALS
jgi:hypothetical protein